MPRRQKPQVSAQQSVSIQVSGNNRWYTDDMINAILGTTVLNANFCHNIRSVGKVTEHVFITPTVTGSNRTGILEDVVLSYYVNKEKQVGKHRVDIFDEPTLF